MDIIYNYFWDKWVSKFKLSSCLGAYLENCPNYHVYMCLASDLNKSIAGHKLKFSWGKVLVLYKATRSCEINIVKISLVEYLSGLKISFNTDGFLGCSEDIDDIPCYIYLLLTSKWVDSTIS